MFYKLVFQHELWPQVSERLQLRIQLDFGKLESFTTSQQIGDEQNCTVSTLRSELVGSSHQTINLRDGAGEGRDASREISRHFVVDSH